MRPRIKNEDKKIFISYYKVIAKYLHNYSRVTLWQKQRNVIPIYLTNYQKNSKKLLAPIISMKQKQLEMQ